MIRTGFVFPVVLLFSALSILFAPGLATAECVDAPAGLSAWWPAALDTKDAVGANDGFLNGAVSHGFIGGAFRFDGTDFMRLSRPASVSRGSFLPYTVEGWIRPTTVEGVRSIFSKFNGGIAAEHGLWVTEGALEAYRNVSPWVTRGSIPIDTHRWTHVAMTYECEGCPIGGLGPLRVYVNGELDAEKLFTSQPAFPDVPALVGARLDFNSPNDFFEGDIDELSIYDRALTANEIRSIFDAGRDGKCAR